MDPFFKRSYHFNLPNDEARPANATVNYTLTGYNIPGSGVELSYGNYANAISSYGPAAFASLGFEANHDFNSGNLTGYGYFPSTIDPVTGLRSSAESGLLSPAIAKSPLLTIYQSCMARNILFDGQKRATGVNVTVDGIKPFTLTARKEVIHSYRTQGSHSLGWCIPFPPAFDGIRRGTSLYPGTVQHLRDLRP
jgi:choline dehydrogenase